MNDLTPNEREIVRILREMQPYEEVRVIKDQQGRVDHYFITRTQKVVLRNTSVIHRGRGLTEHE